MVNSIYLFSEVEARTATPMTISRAIKDVLSANGDACYIEMERYLRGAANTGSAQFDHAHAVRVLLKHDKDNGGILHIIMVEKEMTEKELWDRLTRVLAQAGFNFRNGKMVGLLIEDKRGSESEGHSEAA